VCRGTHTRKIASRTLEVNEDHRLDHGILKGFFVQEIILHFFGEHFEDGGGFCSLTTTNIPAVGVDEFS
jgi:hypothetical protein